MACVRNPATGERQLTLLSQRQEIELGERGAQEVRATIGLVDDAGVQSYVERVGQRLAERSEKPDLPWSFGVVDDPTPNAFALPGGKIFITRGLLVHMQNEAQLAGVLGHEIGHVTARHSAEQISKMQLAQTGLGLGSLLLEDGGQLLSLAGAGMQLVFLKFGRDDEHQADELGVRYATRADYDVREMPEVFETLARISEASGSGRLPEWLSTHPHPEDRIERIQEEIAKTGAPKDGTVARREFLRQVDGLVYGVDPRGGYFEGEHFFHPGLELQVRVPQNWQRVSYPVAMIAASPEQDAMLQLTMAAASEPERGLAAFAEQAGVQVGERVDVVPDFPSASASFFAQTEQGALRGTVSFVAVGDQLLELLTVATASSHSQHASQLARLHGSLVKLTDPARLTAKPARVELIEVPSTTTLSALYARHESIVPLDRIALLNQMQPETELRAGQLVKWVSGGSAAFVSRAPPRAATSRHSQEPAR